MECGSYDIKGMDEVLGQIGHHVIRTGQFALFGDVEAAEQEMEIAITLLKSTRP